MDYTFAVEAGVTITILTVRVVLSGWSGATVVPGKGPIEYAVRWAVAFRRGAGSQPYKLRVDKEASICSVAQVVADELANGSVVEQAPTGSHQSVGVIERYHAELHSTIRAQRAELEGKIGRKLVLEMPLYVWLVRHSAWCLPRYGLYGGRSPHERLFGTEFDSPVANFGENVLARDPGAAERGNHAPRRHEGWWLGRAEGTNEP
jgi:hypothetical protein